MRVTPSAIPFLCQRSRNDCDVFIQSQCAIDRAGGMVRLLAGGAEQHVQGIADDLCDRAIMGEHDVGHAREIVIEKRSEHARARASPRAR